MPTVLLQGMAGRRRSLGREWAQKYAQEHPHTAPTAPVAQEEDREAHLAPQLTKLPSLWQVSASVGGPARLS